MTESYDSNFLSVCWGGRGFTPGLWRLGTCNLIPQASHFLHRLPKVNALDRRHCVSVCIIANKKLHRAKPERPHHMLIEMLETDVLITYQCKVIGSTNEVWNLQFALWRLRRFMSSREWSLVDLRSVTSVSEALTVSRVRDQVLFLGCLDCEQRGSKLLRNVANYLPSHTVSHRRRLRFSS